jgi:hypothetical protein
MATRKKKEKREPLIDTIKAYRPNGEDLLKLEEIQRIEKRFGERIRIPIVGGYVLTTRPEHYRSKRM